MSTLPDPPAAPRAAGARAAASALSGHIDTRTAAMEVAEQLQDALGDRCELLLCFASFHHRAALHDALEHARRALRPRVALAVTAEAVLANDEEREGRAGLAALGLGRGGGRLHPWCITPLHLPELRDGDAMRRHLGVADDTRGVIMFADPFTTPMPQILSALDRPSPVPVAGGMASGASQPGLNVLLVNDRAVSAGAVGVTLSGSADLDFIVSQGCRPIGRPVVVTKVKDNVIHELGGQVAMSALKEMTVGLDERDRGLMNRGLLIGVVINEYKGRFGRGDFLVRNVMGLDLKRGHIAVAERLRVGQTIQFHVRDAESADEDLRLLLDAQELDRPPLAAALFTCNGRGTRLFETAHHDAGVIRGRLGGLALAGFFAAGEIGPVGDRSFVHGHTASVVLFR
jgi:small ligand-binding sensory domain FIST